MRPPLRRFVSSAAVLAAALGAAAGCSSPGGSGAGDGPPSAESGTVPGSGGAPPREPGPPPVHGYTMVRALDHDPAAFTQGLVYEDGVFYESTGLYGRSSVRRLDASTGEILHRVDLGGGAFGEGLTLWNDKLYQLTWKENRGFIYDKSTLARVGVFSFPSTEGWGLTHDESRFIFSDGSDILYFLDPESFAVTGRISVRDPGGHVPRLNELEYVDGEIWANVLQTDRIARIDPETGRVVGWIDLTGLLTPEMCAEPIDVMNGIAYDAAGGRVFVTGKHWCLLFEIRVE